MVSSLRSRAFEAAQLLDPVGGYWTLILIIEAGGDLRTSKQLDFNKFKEIVKLISQK